MAKATSDVTPEQQLVKGNLRHLSIQMARYAIIVDKLLLGVQDSVDGCWKVKAVLTEAPPLQNVM